MFLFWVPLRLISGLSCASHVLFFLLLALGQSNLPSSFSHFKAFMLMLWLLAVLSQRAMSLLLRQLAGSPGCCVARLPHPWLIPQLSVRQGYVIPAGIQGEEPVLPGCITASWVKTAYALCMLSVSQRSSFDINEAAVTSLSTLS